MAYLRASLLLLALLGFYAVGAPLQWLALERGWRLAKWIPGFFHRTMCRILRIRVHVKGALAPTKPLLIISNHVSWVDILTLSAGEPVCFLAKQEVRSWPVFGAFAKLQGSIFVDRARLTDLPKVNAEIAARLLAGDKIVIFAESTTSDGVGLLRFRAAHFGAAQTLLAEAPAAPHVAIQPAAVTYVSCDRQTEIAWYGEMEMLPHLWLLLKGGPFECTIHYGPPLMFDRATDRKTAARATEAAVRRLLAPVAAGPERSCEPTAILLRNESL